MALNLRPHKQRPGWLRRFLGEDPSGSLVCVLHHANRPPAVVIEGRWVPGFRVLGFRIMIYGILDPGLEEEKIGHEGRGQLFSAMGC